MAIPPSWPVEAAALTIMVIGAALTVFCWRGRLVGTHPICRRCDYDLFGRPAGSNVCAECGSDLTRPRAVTVGRRRKRWWGVAAGMLTLMLAGSWLGAVVWMTLSGNDARQKPFWWLLLEAKGRDPARRKAAVSELTSRWYRDTLSPQHANRLMDLLLTIQAERSRAWLGRFGEGQADPILQAYKKKMLDEVRWERYCRQDWDISIVTRRLVRRGDPLPLAVVVDPRWLSCWSLSSKRLFLQFDYEIASVSLDGIALSLPNAKGWFNAEPNMGFPSSFSSPPHFTTIPQPLMGRLSDGAHRLSAVLELSMSDVSGEFDRSQSSPATRAVLSNSPGLPSKRLFRTRLNIETTFQLVPANTEVLQLVQPTPAEPDLVDRYSVRLAVKRLRLSPDGRELAFDVDSFIHGDATMAGKLYLRTDGRERLIGHWLGPPTNSLGGQPVRLRVDNADLEQLDFVFRPDPEVLLRPSEHDLGERSGFAAEKIWGEEIVLEGLPVDRSALIDNAKSAEDD